VGIFDATNTTRERRAAVLQRCLAYTGHAATVACGSASPSQLASKAPIQVVFVESICDDPVILERNYAMKLSNADYRDKDPVAAREDFLGRVAKYERVYETISEDELSYIKLINVGQRVRSSPLAVCVCCAVLHCGVCGAGDHQSVQWVSDLSHFVGLVQHAH
jgi:hypothetical protein